MSLSMNSSNLECLVLSFLLWIGLCLGGQLPLDNSPLFADHTPSERSQLPERWISRPPSILSTPPPPSPGSSMASSGLAPNSFLVTTASPSKPSLRSRRFVVLAKNDPSSSDGGGNSKPFQFNFGKLPDIKSLVPAVSGSPAGLSLGAARRKDAGTVFVAGANGQVGVRIVQALLRQGFKVRAGVAELTAAQELARFAAQYKVISSEESKRLNAVQSTYDDAESIAKSIGNSSKVVVTIGSAENGPAAEVTTSDALQVVEAAQLAGVSHVAIIYDESASVSSTNNVLDGISSFFNNLFAQSQPLTVSEFLQKVVATDVRYTFIKTKLTDDFLPESSYNVVVAAEGSYGVKDYKVSKSRMATIVADIFSNTSVAENKVVEVYTDPQGPRKTIDELFSAIPEDGRRQVYAEAQAKAEAEEKAAERAQEAAAKAAKKASEQESAAAEDAKEKADALGPSVESLFSKAKDISSGLSWEKLRSQLNTAVQNSVDDESPKVQVATVRGQAKARTLPSLKAVTKKPAFRKPPPPKKAKEAEPKKEVKNILGGLFKQETIYVDDA